MKRPRAEIHKDDRMTAKFTAMDAAKLLDITVQAVHQQLRRKGLPFQKTQNRVYFGHATARELFKVAFTPQMIAFQIVKGGTGKTTLAHSIAIRANLYGARVLCVDLDQQANLTQALRVNAEEAPVMVDVIKSGLALTDAIIPVSEGLDLIPSRIENAILDNVLMLERLPLDRVYRERFRPLRDAYDLIVVDCPPALGQSVAAVALTTNLVIAPVTPEEFSLSGLKISSQEISNLEQNFSVSIPFRLILNKFDTRTALSHEVLSTLIKNPLFGEKLFKTYVRASQEFPNVIATATSIFDSLRTSPAKEDIDLLTREILGIVPKAATQDVSLGTLEKSIPFGEES